MSKPRITKDHWLYTMPVAHRGLHGEGAPENSMAAFGRAVEAGYAIELDVHATKDEQIVVSHDANLSRMFGVDVNIAEHTYAELRSYTMTGTREKLPLLAEVLRIADVPLLIEIKSEKKVGRLEQALYAQLRNYKGEFALQSFNPYSLRWYVKNKPQWLRGQLSCAFEGSDMGGLKKALLKNLHLNFMARPDFISYSVGDLPCPAVQKAREAGKPILGWTVDSQELADQKKDLIDNIIFENFTPRKA